MPAGPGAAADGAAGGNASHVDNIAVDSGAAAATGADGAEGGGNAMGGGGHTTLRGAALSTQAAAVAGGGQEETGSEEGDLEDDSLCDLFTCAICGDVHVDPLVLPCCGKAFCRACLRQWIRSNVRSSGYPRCPQGCVGRLKYRLPQPSQTLQAAMEGVIPHKLRDRRRELREDAAEEAGEDDEEQICHGGFRPWQEVAAATDVSFEGKIGVRQGTPGIVVGNMGDPIHLLVKFDRREDDSELCVKVVPQALMEPLPENLRLGQRIVAADDLVVGGTDVAVTLGMGGVIVGSQADEHLHVLFDHRLDGLQAPVILSATQVQPDCRLVGGFRIGQRIQAFSDLRVGERVVAEPAALGTVHCAFGETRLTVNMDLEASTSTRLRLNVLPTEIALWCKPPADFPSGHPVETTVELWGRGSIMKIGTCGTIASGVNRAQVLVSFAQVPAGANDGEEPSTASSCYHMIVDLGAIKSCETGQLSEASLKCGEGHTLSPFVSSRAGYQCDSCQATLLCGSSMLGCRACDYDMCIDCVVQTS